ncbi:hypothetical protein SH661x_001250 [Planctomicrobium sp. SH661]|uniref:hypothetical protein n=1 Tax=Planctomicrobium sp. SH661 TaxID=3448124 RepID=UPI003F5B0080
MEETLRLERRPPTLAIILTVAVAALVAAYLITATPHFLIAAALPLVYAVWFWLARPSESTLVFGPDSVKDELQERSIFYNEICGLTISGTTPPADKVPDNPGTLIIVKDSRYQYHRDLNRQSAGNAYKNLIDRIPLTGSRQVAQELKQRLANDLSMFDDDLVYTYRARDEMQSPRSLATGMFAAFLGVAIIWIIAGNQDRSLEAWTAVGIITGVIALIGLVLSAWSTNSFYGKAIPNRLSASLIVSPRGIALVQGRLTGELKWGEMKSIECGHISGDTFPALSTPRIIAIKVDGALIPIHDIYDRPLATIHRCMKRYWETR